MTLITKIPGVVFTDTSLPKLYRDSVINTGTKYCFDTADTYSYAQKPVPVTGDWKDLTPNHETTLFGSAAVFSAGGFTLNPTTGSNVITLPATGRPVSGSAGFLAVVWIKHLALNSAGAYGAVFGIADNTTPATHCYSIDTGPTSSGQYRCLINGAAVVTAYTPAIGSITQFALVAKKQVDGTYLALVYRNGVLVGSVSTPTLGQPVKANPVIGLLPSHGHGACFRVFRTFYDDTSKLETQAAITALVLKDYNDNVGRFS